MKKVVIGILAVIGILSIILFAGALFLVKKAEQEYKKDVQTTNNLKAPIEIPVDNVVKYSEVNDFEKPMLVMFYVDWCGYCRRYMPIFGELAKEYADKYTFALVNCDEPENKTFYKEMGVMGFPTLFIIDKKNDFHFTVNMAGTQDVELMRSELNRYLNLREKIKA